MYTHLQGFSTKKKAAPSGEAQPGCRTEFQHPGQVWKHAFGPWPITWAWISCQSKGVHTVFLCWQYTWNICRLQRRGWKDKTHFYHLSLPLCFSVFPFFLVVFFYCVSNSLYCFVSLHVARVWFLLFLLKQFVKAELPKLYSKHEKKNIENKIKIRVISYISRSYFSARVPFNKVWCDPWFEPVIWHLYSQTAVCFSAPNRVPRLRPLLSKGAAWWFHKGLVCPECQAVCVLSLCVYQWECVCVRLALWKPN